MSRFEPGKTTTPIRTLTRRVPRRSRGRRRRRADERRRRPERLDLVRLDQRVREQLARQPLDDRPGRGLVGRRDRQLDPPADPDVADPVDPEVAEAALDGPALRVEDPGLRAGR